MKDKDVTKTKEIPVHIKVLNERAKIPTRGSEQAAGYDLYACMNEGIDFAQIAPHGTVVIGTGISMALPDGTFGGIFARSGLAAKENLRPANCVGAVDSDYRGEVKVALHNDSNEIRTIYHGDRIAQLIVLPYVPANFIEVENLDETERGAGGFGHTGIK